MGWLLQSERCVPDCDGWLAPEEREVLATLRFERRRRDWRLGRWAAKRALLASHLAGARAEEIAILADSEGAPHVFHRGEPADCSVSISHRGDHAFAVAVPRHVPIGCDLEVIEPRSDAFVADYFTEREQRLVNEAPPAERDLLANLVWSAKESAVKVLGTGWRVDTRSVEVDPLRGRERRGWTPLGVRCFESGESLRGVWRRFGPLLVTVAGHAREHADPSVITPRRTGTGRAASGPPA